MRTFRHRADRSKSFCQTGPQQSTHLPGGAAYLDCAMYCLDSSHKSIQVSFLGSGMITRFFMGLPVPGSWGSPWLDSIS